MTEKSNFPESWWNADRPLVFGHRGASCAAPENTLPAFREALAMGIDGVELDVHLSFDNVPMVIHDARVDSCTDGSGYVSSMTRAQLKDLDAGAHFSEDFTGERIPTLEEVLSEVGKDMLFNIELKDPAGRSMGIELAVVNVIRHLGLEKRVWFSSFKPYMLYQIHKFAPQIPCGMLYGPLNMSSMLLAPITPHEAIHPQSGLVSRSLVQRVHRRGKYVATWTVDDPLKAQKLADWGVDVLISNNPKQILDALSAKDEVAASPDVA